jgi:uncharacterized membrane protein YtjA (UPF0391 family)
MKQDFRIWAILFLAVSIIAAVTGFFLIVGFMAIIVKILFVVFAVLFLTFWLRHYRRHHLHH